MWGSVIPVWKTNKCERNSETESERVVVRVVGTTYDSCIIIYQTKCKTMTMLIQPMIV